MAIIDEKADPSHVEKATSDSDSDNGVFSKREEAKIRHRIDRRLIPALGLMYGISLMDRKASLKRQHLLQNNTNLIIECLQRCHRWNAY
jgi:hypothetical protein